MKRIINILTLALFSLLLVACSNDRNDKLVIGVSPIPHEEIVSLIKDDLKKDGIDLEIVVFNDYVQPNLALKDKSLDANFFQHVPYMEEFGKKNDIDMVSAGTVHVEPLKIYSSKVKSISELDKLKTVSILIPNDPTNRGRSLILLETAGILKLKDSKKLDSGLEDIKSIDKKYVITELNSEQIGPRLDEVELAVINTNNALASKITKDKAVFVEGKESPYANIVTVLRGNENTEKIKKLMKHLQSQKVKEFINSKYNGEVVEAF
ncbi:MetQ/NlpA family ABC transporter substrate-binding protein [Oceanivirga miroungae]|uniref:Immunogenic lipoprotein A n=1 Tax=Oceanivirga miroungae TaxID=1130046 RepID=A0A6I8MC13_9FUSO|nr:MetQ/NlpA family ABC transporter substrate-binding protein [Oceanivirga miroungae]VWL85778.1 immunogenic lipoprotein A [Oceanivirga miroungae]